MQLTRDELNRLTPQERLNLIEQLWDSLSDADLPLTPAQEAELERRLITLDRDSANGVSWEELKAELSNRCP